MVAHSLEDVDLRRQAAAHEYEEHWHLDLRRESGGGVSSYGLINDVRRYNNVSTPSQARRFAYRDFSPSPWGRPLTP